MKKRINETIAKCKCRFRGCELSADVRRMKNHERGNLYMVCSDHGIDKANSEKAQKILNSWVENNTIKEGEVLEQAQEHAQEIPEIIQEPQKPQEPIETPVAQEQEQEQKPVKKGFWSGASEQFQEWFKD